MRFLGKLSRGKERESSTLRNDLLNKLEIYNEAMHYLTTLEHFDASKFERLDEILSKAKASLGPEKRREMLLQSQYILPTSEHPHGGVEELKVILLDNLSRSFQALNEILYKVSPTPETAMEIKRIADKYR